MERLGGALVALATGVVMLERFRAVRDQIGVRMREWLEHPEEELARLREERESERRERLEDEKSEREAASVGKQTGDTGHDPFRCA